MMLISVEVNIETNHRHPAASSSQSQACTQKSHVALSYSIFVLFCFFINCSLTCSQGEREDQAADLPADTEGCGEGGRDGED